MDKKLPEEIRYTEDLHGAIPWAFLEDPNRPDSLKPEHEQEHKFEKEPKQKLVKKPEQKPRQLIAPNCVPEMVTVTVTSTIDVESVTLVARDQVTPLPSSPSKDVNEAKYLKMLQSFLGLAKTSPTTIPLMGRDHSRRDLSEDPRLFLNEQELGEYLDKIQQLDYKDPIGGVTGPPPNAEYDLELKALNEWLQNKKIEPPSVDHLPISERPFYAPFFKTATTTEEYQPYLATGTPNAKIGAKAMLLAIREPPRLMWPAFRVSTEPPKPKATDMSKSQAETKIEARATPLGTRDPPSVEAPLILVSTEERSIVTGTSPETSNEKAQSTPTPAAVMERVVVPGHKETPYGPAWVKDRKLPTFAIEKDYTDEKEFDTTEMDPEIAAKINQAVNIGKEAGSLVISPDRNIILTHQNVKKGGYTNEKEFDVGKMDPEFLAKMEQAVKSGKEAGSLVISPDKTIIHARRNEECTSPICRLDRESLSVVLICLFILGAIVVVIGLIFVMYYVPKGWRKLTKKVKKMRGSAAAAAAAQELEFKEMVRESSENEARNVARPKDVYMV